LPSIASAYSLVLGNEKIYIDVEYESSRVNSESDGSVAELSFNYDPSLNDEWSLWMYNTTRREKNKELDINIENFVGGGIKHSFADKLSLSYGPTGHYINKQWDWLHSWRLKLKGNLYATLSYKHDIGLESEYFTDGVVGYKINKLLRVWHKRQRREGYHKIYNGVGVHYEL
jgi:hypothetical protein